MCGALNASNLLYRNALSLLLLLLLQLLCNPLGSHLLHKEARLWRQWLGVPVH